MRVGLVVLQKLCRVQGYGGACMQALLALTQAVALAVTHDCMGSVHISMVAELAVVASAWDPVSAGWWLTAQLAGKVMIVCPRSALLLMNWFLQALDTNADCALV